MQEIPSSIIIEVVTVLGCACDSGSSKHDNGCIITYDIMVDFDLNLRCNQLFKYYCVGGGWGT